MPDSSRHIDATASVARIPQAVVARIKFRDQPKVFLAERCDEHEQFVEARGRWDWSHGVNRANPRFSGPRVISRTWRDVEWIDWVAEEQVAA